MNAKHICWECNNNNSKGNTLTTYLETGKTDITIHAPDAPTHYSIGRLDILDIVITK